MKKIITFGEIMMRFMPEGYERFVQAEKFEATYAGGEANVAVSLANYGLSAAFVSKIPSHEIGQAAVNALRRYGVDTSHLLRGGERLGVYFVEKGASQRPSKVIYDRKHSAIAQANPEEFDWDVIFDGVQWFHFTGITPALSASCIEICRQALKKAKEKGVTVSCDINYRKNLWSKEDASRVMSELMLYVDVCIANEEDAGDVFGIHAANTDISGGKLNKNGYIDVARQLTERFKCKMTAITLRGSISANDNNWSGMLYDGKNGYFAQNYLIHIVDRVGGGDSFGGALIYALIAGFATQEAINFAVAASCLKHSIEGDFNQVSIKEILNLVDGDSSGRVQR